MRIPSWASSRGPSRPSPEIRRSTKERRCGSTAFLRTKAACFAATLAMAVATAASGVAASDRDAGPVPAPGGAVPQGAPGGSHGSRLTALSLQEAVRMALERNEAVLIAREAARKASAGVSEARSGVLPQISLQGVYQRNIMKPAMFLPKEFAMMMMCGQGDAGGDSAGPPPEIPDHIKVEIGSDIEANGALRLDQVLFAFGRIGNAVKYASLYKRMAERGIALAEDQITFAVKEAYYRVLLLERLRRIREESVDQARSHLEIVRNKFEHGAASRFELKRAGVEVRNRIPELISAENALSLARRDLARLIGLDGGDSLALTDTLRYEPVHVSEEAAISAALSNRPEIQSLEARVEAQKKLVSIYKASNLPIFGLFAQLALQGQAGAEHPLDVFKEGNRATSLSAGITVSLPLFDGLKGRAKTEQARADLRQAQLELRQAAEAIKLEVSKAVRDLESVQREYEAQLAGVELAEEMYKIAVTRFENGLSTQLELTDAETALDYARTGAAEALYRYNVGKANLERVTGTSIGTLCGRSTR